MDAIEAFPGVTLWQKFDNTCKQAEAVRDRAEVGGNQRTGPGHKLGSGSGLDRVRPRPKSGKRPIRSKNDHGADKIRQGMRKCRGRVDEGA